MECYDKIIYRKKVGYMAEDKTGNKKSPKNKKNFLLAGVSCLVLLVLVLTGCFALGYNSPGPEATQVPVRLADAKKKPKAAKGKKQKNKKNTKDTKTKADTKENLQGKQKGNPVAQKSENKVPDVTAQPLVVGTKYNVLVDKSDHKLYIRNGNLVVRAWDCAVGKGGLGQKQRSGDNMTPVGTFEVDEIDDASGWTHDFGDGQGEIAGAYGPWFLSLDTEDLSGGEWDGIGIHGTHNPRSLGTDASEGCVRLDNNNLRVLKEIAYIGMPVTIQN